MALRRHIRCERLQKATHTQGREHGSQHPPLRFFGTIDIPHIARDHRRPDKRASRYFDRTPANVIPASSAISFFQVVISPNSNWPKCA